MAKERISQSKPVSTSQLTPAKTQTPPLFQLQASPKQPASPTKTTGPKAIDIHKQALALNKKFMAPGTGGSDMPALARQLLALTEQMDEKAKQAILFNDPTARTELAEVHGVKDLDDTDKSLDELSPYNQKAEWEAIENSDSWDQQDVHEGYFDKSGEVIFKNGGGRKRGEVVKRARDKNKGINSASNIDKANQSEKNPGFEIDIKAEELIAILGIGGTTSDLEKEKIDEYLKHAKKAFRLARIDTIEAQANFLAHAAGETHLKSMTEGLRSESNYKDSPYEHVYDRNDKNGIKRYGHHWDPVTKKQVAGEDIQNQYAMDPLKKIEQGVDNRNMSNLEFSISMQNTFLGRGPVQVSTNFNYAQTLVYLEEMARTAKGEDAREIQKAVQAIKKNPGEAANPKYAFLFSAAYMHSSGGLYDVAKLGDKKAREGSSSPNKSSNTPNFNGTDSASSWVAGGTHDVVTKLAVAKEGLKKVNDKIAQTSDKKTLEKLEKEKAGFQDSIAYNTPLADAAGRKSRAYVGIKNLLLKKLSAAKAKAAAGNTP